jgi:hypothetical protein
VLRSAAEIEDDPIFINAADKVIPDPLVYSDWFNDADDRRRKLAVGVDRYQAGSEVQPRPGWELFIDPETGRVLTPAEIRAETPAERGTRLAAVRAIIQRRAQQKAEVAVQGFLSR